MRPAVFLDRDGTLIEERHYLADPAGVRLLPGAAEAVRRLREAGFACVLATNQSGIARGLLTEADLAAVQAELIRRLGAGGAALDAVYWCPAGPDSDDPDRKPRPGMLRRAAADLGLDLAGSWIVGDKLDDVRAGLAAGCRAVLVRTGYGASAERQAAATPGGPIGYHVVDDLPAAASLILAASTTPTDPEGPTR